MSSNRRHFIAQAAAAAGAIALPGLARAHGRLALDFSKCSRPRKYSY